jgi:hypothetical protein
MKEYRVLYWSAFRGQWVEYIAPLHGAKAIRHATADEARARVKSLEHNHPRDKFMVEGPN